MKKLIVTVAAVAAAAGVVVCPRAARADENDGRLRYEMESYDRGKTGESLAYLASGVVSLGAGGASLAAGDPLYRGLSVPLLAGGAVELTTGTVLYLRTARFHADAEDALARGDYEAFRAREMDRVSASRHGLGAATVLETVLFAGGGALAYFSGGVGMETWRGLGYGCAVEGAAMLVLDVLAATRAQRYADALAASGVGVRAGQAGAEITFQRRF
jgi:hypothetical protein